MTLLTAALLGLHRGEDVAAAAATGIDGGPRRLPRYLNGFAAAGGTSEEFSGETDHLRMHLDHTGAHSGKNFNGRLSKMRVFDSNPPLPVCERGTDSNVSARTST